MAKQNTSPKSDPAALAFSAVENALKDSVLSDNETATEKTSKSKKSQAREKVAQKIAGKVDMIANDSFSDVGNEQSSRFLYKLNSKSSSAPFWIAFIISLLWLGATAFVGWLRYGDKLTNFDKLVPFAQTIEFAGLAALAIIPTLGFFAIATLSRRASDLRLAANSMTEVAIQLTQPETSAASKIATVGQAVRREVNALGDGLENALSRASELEVMIHNEVTSLENTYSDNEIRLRKLIEELASQRDSVITNSDRVRDAIAEAHTLMIEDMGKAGNDFSNSIVSHNENALKAIQSANDLLNNTFTEKTNIFVTQIDNSTTDILSALDMNSEKIILSLDDKLNALNEGMQNGTLNLSQSIDEKTQEMNLLLNQTGSVVVAQLETSAEIVNASLEAVGAKIVGDISNKTATAEQMISAITDRVDETLSIKFNTLDSRLNSSVLQIAGAVDEATENAKTTLDAAGALTLSGISSRVDEVALIVDSKLQQMDSVIGEKGEKIIVSLDSHTVAFSSSANLLEVALDEKTSLLDEKLASRTKELIDSIANQTDSLTKTIDGQSTELHSYTDNAIHSISKTMQTHTNDMSEVFDDFSGAITNHTSELAKTIDEQSTAVRSHTDNAVRSISETMKSRTNDMSETVNRQIEKVNDNIGTQVDKAVDRLSEADTGLAHRIDLSASAIEKSTNKTASIIEAGVEAARQSIVDMVDDRLGTLPEAITARADITADRLNALNENINSTINQSMIDLETSATKIEETIGTSIASASLTISNDVEQTAARMDITVRTALDQVKEAARHIEDLVEVRALETANTLSKKVEEMNEAVTTQTDNFANIISSKSEELEGALKSHGNILKTALNESSAEAEELMSASTGRILDDVNGALKKLNDSNLLLQRVLETSSSNLFDLETSVANQTSSYTNAIREAVSSTDQAGKMVAEHVGALQTTIQAVTSEFGTMLSELSNETDNINLASSTLNTAGAGTIDSLQERQEAMNALAQSFTSRADEIDTRMLSFAQSIADTVNDTEDRLNLAKQAMQETLDATTISVASRLDKFTDATDQQGRVANEQLKNTQTSLINEMNLALQEATTRFNETANAMRSTAQQVNEELEATRTELQNNVTELPEETRASAAAMRRVVAEQIEALNELNSIVRTQHSTNDISARKSTRMEYSEPKTPEYNRRATDNSQITSAQSLADILSRPSPKEESTVNVAELLHAEEKASPKKESGNWLRDVLRNASANQAETANKTGINLSNLTQKISHSIDAKALSEAWQRYKSGQPNVFSRRIYTLSGQGTFDELRKKIQRDIEFSRNSSAYIKEFEALLSKTVSDPNAKTSALDLLTSERGKVYTMLAHASGRLS